MDARTSLRTMQLIRPTSPLPIRLNKDLVREIKRGHAWLYSHAVERITAAPGSTVSVLDRRGEKQIASGIYHPQHAIPVRICRTQAPYSLDQDWAQEQLSAAARLRGRYFDSNTTGYRLVAGEGDGLPGLVIDVYGETAVIKLDGGAPESFYQAEGIADWLQSELRISQVVFRPRRRGRAGEFVATQEKLDADADPTPTSPSSSVPFLENGLHFSADVLHGQKTGFFLDQRDNRAMIRRLANQASVLNLFAYTGGFSVAAGAGGARHVTSVDLASPAIETAHQHWTANGLPPARHEGVVADCFEFLESAAQDRSSWELVICDPPSFAPNEKSRPQAVAAYTRLARLAARVTVRGGILALASCSSHIDHQAFQDISSEAIGRARRKARVLAYRGLPVDHPTPLVMGELRYLKFLLLELD